MGRTPFRIRPHGHLSLSDALADVGGDDRSVGRNRRDPLCNSPDDEPEKYGQERAQECHASAHSIALSQSAGVGV
jgi:hypothetical protein